MPLTKGKMKIQQERKLKKNIINLKKNMDAKDLTDFFIQEEIFDFPDIDQINGYNPNTVESRNNCFFQLLFQSGPTAYDVLLQALRNNGQDFLADDIESTEVEGKQVLDDSSWIADIPEQTRKRHLTERDLSKLAQTLGKDWEMVVIDMGLSKADIEHAEMDNHTSTMKIYSCLNMWRTRNYDYANLENFVKIVASCQTTTVNWDEMKRISEKLL